MRRANAMRSEYEEVHRNEYRNLAEARASIQLFLEKIYYRKRLHSALGYVPPAEFKVVLAARNRKDSLGGNFRYEFSEASGNLSVRWRRGGWQRPRSSCG
jgi:hypothetical protein